MWLPVSFRLQVVLTMVAFSTFWLSPECGERLGLAVTIPLAVAVYDLLIWNSLPIAKYELNAASGLCIRITSSAATYLLGLTCI